VTFVYEFFKRIVKYSSKHELELRNKRWQKNQIYEFLKRIVKYSSEHELELRNKRWQKNRTWGGRKNIWAECNDTAVMEFGTKLFVGCKTVVMCKCCGFHQPVQLMLPQILHISHWEAEESQSILACLGGMIIGIQSVFKSQQLNPQVPKEWTSSY